MLNYSKIKTEMAIKKKKWEKTFEWKHVKMTTLAG
jgi:hypothetical protein